jgi:hypothetical protein
MKVSRLRALLARSCPITGRHASLIAVVSAEHDSCVVHCPRCGWTSQSVPCIPLDREPAKPTDADELVGGVLVDRSVIEILELRNAVDAAMRDVDLTGGHR